MKIIAAKKFYFINISKGICQAARQLQKYTNDTRQHKSTVQKK